MTAITLTPSASCDGPPGRLMTPALARLFVAAFCATTSFYLLFSAVPAYAGHIGAGGAVAGLATGVLMVTAVIAELAAPALEARFGRRTTFATALVLLGAPSLVLAVVPGPAAILAACAVRGFGFGVTMVLGGAIAASLVPASRRGEGLGLYGIVVGVPAIVAMPLAVWVGDRFGYPLVFACGGLTALAGVAAALGLQAGASACEPPVALRKALRDPAQFGPAAVFAAAAAAVGVAETFLPITGGAASAGLVALGLFIQATTTTLSRWSAGRRSDRDGIRGQLALGTIMAACGMVLLALDHEAMGLLGGMALLGCGFGVAQNASLAAMYARAKPGGYGAVSAIWNLAYDGGMGLGAAVFGLVAAQIGYAGAFGAVAMVMICAIGPAWRQGRKGPPPSRS